MGGAGGMSASSSAAATGGDQANNAAFQGGGINFGSGSGGNVNQSYVLMGAVALIAAVVFLKKK